MPKTVKSAKLVQTKYNNYLRAKDALRMIKMLKPRQAKTYQELKDNAYQGFIEACVNFANE